MKELDVWIKNVLLHKLKKNYLSCQHTNTNAAFASYHNKPITGAV